MDASKARQKIIKMREERDALEGQLVTQDIRHARTMGIDAAGMSTVPEVLAAHHFNGGRKQPRVEILGVTLITNLAAGVSPTPLSHDEVKRAGEEAAAKFEPFMAEIVKQLD